MEFVPKLVLSGILTLLMGIGAWLARKRLGHFSTWVGSRFSWLWRGVSSYKVLETFFNESAILWFVFPFVDAIYKKNKAEQLSLSELVSLISSSWSIAALFLVVALVFGRIVEESDGQMPRRE